MYAFNHTNLSSITFPENLDTISQRAFCSCKSLTSVTIPTSVQKMEWEVFSFCDNLTSATFLGNPTSIDPSIFAHCSKLSTVRTNSNSVKSIIKEKYPKVKIIDLPQNVMEDERTKLIELVNTMPIENVRKVLKVIEILEIKEEK